MYSSRARPHNLKNRSVCGRVPISEYKCALQRGESVWTTTAISVMPWHAYSRSVVIASLPILSASLTASHMLFGIRRGPRDVVIWCSNDYLGMGQNPKVIDAMAETARRTGTGAGGTRNIAGNNHPLVELERELAVMHRKQAAHVFTSGYVSNETGISTIAKLMPNCLHPFGWSWEIRNSMIEGVRQAPLREAKFSVTMIWRIWRPCSQLQVQPDRS